MRKCLVCKKSIEHKSKVSIYCGKSCAAKNRLKTDNFCKYHKDVKIIRTKSGRRSCKKCNNISSCNARRKTKEKLIDFHGGKCSRCGYSKCKRALDFHHQDPKTKSFNISSFARTASYKKLLEESKKCELLCSNCHREIEDEIYQNKVKEQDDYLRYLGRKPTVIKMCECGKRINKRSKKCIKCSSEIEKPSKEWLAQLVFMMPFTDIAKIYKVTDNSVRKWCNRYNIKVPKFKKGFWLKNINVS